MNIIQEAEKAISLISSGRAALHTIIQAVSDGKAAVTADDQATLNTMLETEENQTKMAIADLRSAIEEYRAGS